MKRKEGTLFAGFETGGAVCVCVCVMEGLSAVCPYLDPADSLLGLHHADVLGRVPLREQLGGAQVVSSKNDAINKIFWLTGPRN